MLLVRVNPFEVYDAERQLRALRIPFQRRQLVDHIIVGFDLQPLVRRCEDKTRQAAEIDFDTLIAEDLACSPMSRTGGLIRRPIREGLIIALLLFAGCWIPVNLYCLFRAKVPVHVLTDSPRFVPTMVISAIVAAILSLGYAFLGAHIGRARARSWSIIFGGLIIVAIGIWLARDSA